MTQGQQGERSLWSFAIVLLALVAGCATAPLPPPAAPAAVPLPAPVVVAPPVLQPPPPVPPRAAISTAEVWRNKDRASMPGDPARIDLWVRLRRGLAMQELDDDLVRKWEAYYAERPDYVARMVDRGSRYLFYIVEEVDARGLPMELALLPFIESAFNPHAESSAAAAGMWQFVAATGREFDLKQNVFRDDRRDVIASTRAALDYLEQLNAQFDDWHLALAAYNWGKGSVRRAQRRNAQQRQGIDYASLNMPAETRNYVPKLLAIKHIIERPGDFGLVLPPLENHPFFLGVGLERDIDVDLAARLSGMTVPEFKQFNPQINQPVVLAAGTPQLLLPYDNANAFLRGLGEHRGPLATWTAWVAPRTVSVAEAARTVGMTEAALREVNGIPPRMRVKAGSTLLVPRDPQADEDVSEHLADHAAIVLAPDAPPLRRVTVKARKGDSVALVAKRYRVGAQQVAGWNGVRRNAVFKPGQQVVLMLPARKPSTGRHGSKSGKQPVKASKGTSTKATASR